MAEEVGFEPTGRFGALVCFQDRCNRPLCHSSDFGCISFGALEGS